MNLSRNPNETVTYLSTLENIVGKGEISPLPTMQEKRCMARCKAKINYTQVSLMRHLIFHLIIPTFNDPVKQKMLVTNIFSFFHNVFYIIKHKFIL